jgi:hypothetical protein
MRLYIAREVLALVVHHFAVECPKRTNVNNQWAKNQPEFRLVFLMSTVVNNNNNNKTKQALTKA